MKPYKKGTITLLLFLSTFFCVATGSGKLILPYVFIELTILFYLFTGLLGQEEILFLVQFGLLHFSILILLKFNNIFLRVVIPLIFLLSYLYHNFSDFNFLDWQYAVLSIMPFLVLWYGLVFKFD